MNMTGTFETLEESESFFLSVPMRGQLEAQLEQLKQRLLKPMLESLGNTELISELSWAANEAAALAWFTICPILVLPTLLEEKSAPLWKNGRSKPRCGSSD